MQCHFLLSLSILICGLVFQYILKVLSHEKCRMVYQYNDVNELLRQSYSRSHFFYVYLNIVLEIFPAVFVALRITFGHISERSVKSKIYWEYVYKNGLCTVMRSLSSKCCVLPLN